MYRISCINIGNYTTTINENIEYYVTLSITCLCLPSDRRSEMCVDVSCEAVVVILGRCQGTTAEVDGLHHAACGEDTQHSVEVWIVREGSCVERLCQRLA